MGDPPGRPFFLGKQGRVEGHRPPQGPCLGLDAALEEAKGAFFGAARLILLVRRMRNTMRKPKKRKPATPVPAI